MSILANWKILVTGGGGFLGSHLCERLINEGSEVVCLDNFATSSPINVESFRTHSNFTLISTDIVDRLEVGGKFDAILHFASPASPQDYMSLPIETMLVGSIGTQRALSLAHRSGARFLLASTSEVYGDPLVHPQPESYWGNVNPVGPRAVYDEAKRFSEALSVAYRNVHALDVRIARIFNTFGPRMRPTDGRMVPNFVCQAISGEPITVTGDGSQTRCLCYVSDTVDGIVRLLESEHERGPVNIGGVSELAVLDIAEMIRALTDSTSVVEFIERPENDPCRRKPDIARARSSLGWQPVVDVEVGLRRTIDWFLKTSDHRVNQTGGDSAPMERHEPVSAQTGRSPTDRRSHLGAERHLTDV
ncbi:UDP-glucuronic acid decarboxylase family protein [Mycobacterium haemophilum]|uniref:UDP-glucuronic acid decarboxylase family protein n=1 Tax=Mycobacterium haemophilum TaxID=29311 RepID=UPI000A80033A|nr:UDP-glucuronic acid decarboxylase family protein [Mycobacterium haemophilum]